MYLVKNSSVRQTTFNTFSKHYLIFFHDTKIYSQITLIECAYVQEHLVSLIVNRRQEKREVIKHKQFGWL